MFVARSAEAYRDSLVASPNICGANNPPSVLRYPLSISCGNFPVRVRLCDVDHLGASQRGEVGGAAAPVDR